MSLLALRSLFQPGLAPFVTPVATGISARTPTVVENNTTNSTVANTTTALVGDYVVMSVAADSVINNPTGWTPLFTQINQAVDFIVYGRFMDGTSADTPTVTKVDTTTNNRTSIICQPFSGVNTTTPMDVTPSTIGDSTADSSLATPSITTVTPGAVAVSAAAIDASNSTYAFTLSGTGWTETAETAGTGRRQAVATKPMAAAGATGTATWSQTGGALVMVGVTLALRPVTTTIKPVIRDIKTGAEATDSATSHTVAKPSGLAVGDYLIAFVGTDAEGVPANMTASGFSTSPTSAAGSGTGNGSGQKIWTKVADASDINVNPYTFGDSVVPGSEQETILVCIQAGTYNPSNPVTFSSYAQSNRIASMVQTAPSMTGVVDGLLLASFVTESNGVLQNYSSSTPPTGMTFRATVAGDPSTPYSVSGLFSQELTSTAATGTKSVTPTINAGGTTVNNGWAAISAIVNPAVGAGSSAVIPALKTATLDGQQNAPTATPTKPAPLAVDDYMVAVQVADADGSLASMTAPTGWIELGAQAGAVGQSPYVKLWGKVASAADVAAASFPFPDSSGSNALAAVIPIAAGTYNTAQPITGLVFNRNDTRDDASTYPDIPSTTGVNNGLLVGGISAHYGSGSAGIYSATPPTGMTQVLNGRGGATYINLGVWSQALTSTAATGVRTATPVSLTSEGVVGWSLVVNPPTTVIVPSIRSSSTGFSASGSTDAVVTKPSGLAENDLIIAFQQASADEATSAAALSTNMTAPTGFIPRVSQVGGSTVTNVPSHKVYTKIASAADAAAANFTFKDVSADGEQSVIMIAVKSGTFDPYSPINFSDYVSQVAVSGLSQTAPSMNADANDLLLCFFGMDTNASVHNYPASGPAGMTQVAWVQDDVSPYSLQGVYSEARPTAGATGTRTVVPGGATSFAGKGQIQLSMLINAPTPGATYPASMAPFAGADANAPIGVALNRTGGYSGSPTAFAWKVSSGPDQVGDVVSTSAALSWTPTSLGEYVLTFFVTNAYGTEYDQVTITGIPAGPPTVTVGGAATHSMLVNETLTRTATETNSPTSRSWTVNSGPARVGEVLSTTTALSFVPTVPGTYVLRFTATNGTGSNFADLTVTVSNPPFPDIDAGADPPSFSLGNSFLRTATENSVVQVTARAWTVTSGPAQVGAVLSTSSSIAWTPATAGRYVLTYSATNPAGTDSDTVTVNVGILPASRLNIGLTPGKNHFAVDIGVSGQPARILYSTTQIANGLAMYPEFYANPTDTATQFWTQVDAPTTSGSSYARSEMRETTEDGLSDFGFNPRNGGVHRIRAKSKITRVPTTKPEVISGQLHSGLGDAIQIRTQLISSVVRLVLRVNGTGTGIPRFSENYAVGTEFEWMIEQDGERIYVYYNDMSVPHYSFLASTLVDDTANYNFKVGNYLQSNVSTELGVTTEWGSVEHRNLSHWHTGWATPDNYTGLPTADAGADPAAFTVGGTFSRTATEGGSPTARKWTVIDGPVAAGGGTGAIGSTLATATAVNFTPTVAGTYVLRFTTTNAVGSVGDNVRVTVNANVPPTVDPIPDGSVLVGNAFTRTAVESGSPATSRSWTITSAPAGATYSNPLSTTTSVSYTPNVAGVYNLRYTATNGAGSTVDDVLLTVNGPPIVDAGVDQTIANRTEVSRNATETGGGGITSRSWIIQAGPTGVGSTLSTSAALSWTPNVPGTYTLRYTATNPYGTNSNDAIITVTPVVVALPATTEQAVSSATANLAVRKVYRFGETEVAQSSATGSIGRIRKISGTKTAVASAAGGTPRVVSRLAKVVQATTPATGALAVRRLWRESKTVTATSSVVGRNLRRIRTISGTATSTTPTVANKLFRVIKFGAEKATATTPTVSSKLTVVYKFVNEKSTAVASGVSKLSSRLFYSKTVAAASSVRPLSLAAPSTLRATAKSTATGTLSLHARMSKTVTATSPTTGKLIGARRVLATSTSAATATAALTKTLRIPAPVVQSYSNVSPPVRLNKRDRIREVDVTRASTIGTGTLGIISPLGAAQIARAISSVPAVPLRRIGRIFEVEAAKSTVTWNFPRISFMSGTISATSPIPPTKLVRMRRLSAPASIIARGTIPNRKLNRASVLFFNLRARSSTSTRLNSLTRFGLYQLNARGRLFERGGRAYLTTAKAVTSSPRNNSRQTRVLEGYTTVQAVTIGDLIKKRYAGLIEARGRVKNTGFKAVRGLKGRAVAKTRAKNPQAPAIRSLSTVVRIFEDEEYDRYVSEENYTGSNLVVAAAPREDQPAVFDRTFTRMRR